MHAVAPNYRLKDLLALGTAVPFGPAWPTRLVEAFFTNMRFALADLGVYLFVCAQANETVKSSARLTKSSRKAAITADIALFLVSGLPDDGIQFTGAFTAL